jgi:hypothetical protein
MDSKCQPAENGDSEADRQRCCAAWMLLQNGRDDKGIPLRSPVIVRNAVIDLRPAPFDSRGAAQAIISSYQGHIVVVYMIRA